MAPLTISHAACKGHAPENTLAGIRAALALGVDAIEIDVHATRDGTPVLVHDDTVDRTTDGTGPVAELTLEEVRGFLAGGEDARFQDERIPTLAEVLALTRGVCLLVIEIKQPQIETIVVDAVRRMGATADAMIWSFHPEVVAAARRAAPEIPAAQLLGPAAADLATVLERTVRAGAQGLSVHHTALDAGFVWQARRRGLSVFSWTVDEPAEQARIAALGVDGICTNVPDVLAATLLREQYEPAARAGTGRPAGTP